MSEQHAINTHTQETIDAKWGCWSCQGVLHPEASAAHNTVLAILSTTIDESLVTYTAKLTYDPRFSKCSGVRVRKMSQDLEPGACRSAVQAELEELRQAVGKNGEATALRPIVWQRAQTILKIEA